MHPTQGGGRGEVTWVGFHDERVGIPFLQPADEIPLITKIKRTAKQMQIIRFDMTGDLDRAACDHFLGAGLTSEETHAAFTLLRKKIKKRNTITWQDALL